MSGSSSPPPSDRAAGQGDAPEPAVIVVSHQHTDVLLEEFRSRCHRHYELFAATDAAGAKRVAQQVVEGGGQVALFVTDSRLPDVGHVREAIHRWRVVVPTARRVIAAH